MSDMTKTEKALMVIIVVLIVAWLAYGIATRQPLDLR